MSDPDWWVTFGATIREARVARGLTQTELGDMLGVTRSTIANVESGRQHVLADRAAQLVTELGISIPGWQRNRSVDTLAAELAAARQALKDAARHADDAAAAAREALT